MNNSLIDRTWMLLRMTYAAVPIVIGLDKCFYWWLANWTQYTSPIIVSYFPVSMLQFIVLTGIIEIFAGLLVWFLPRIGAYVVTAWMLLVIIDLASMNMFYDIIARDAVIGIGALALAWLSEARTK